MCHIEPEERKNHAAGCATESSQKAHFTVRHHFSKFTTLSLFGIALRIAFQQHQNVPIVILDTLDSEKKSQNSLFSSILCFRIILWFSKTQKSLESRTKRNQPYI